MAITDSFTKAIETGDVSSIRIMMKDSLLVDLTFSEFGEMEGLTRGVSGLYDVHDKREFQLDKSIWNDDYMNREMVRVVGNFSHERIDHLKEVVRYLRPAAARQKQTASSQTSQPRNGSYNEQKHQDQRYYRRNSSDRSTKIVGGVAAGGVAGGVIAGIIKGPILVGVVIGAVVVGAVVAIATSGE